MSPVKSGNRENNARKAGGGTEVTCGDLIVDYLSRMEISRIFGVPGGAIEPFFDAVARRPEGPRMVVARHESGAAFMADGYSRETGLPGVCCSTTGPGATNLITGVSSAYSDNIPMLVITAQTALPKFGRQALQDSSCTAVDVVGMLRYCTRYNTLVSHPDQLETKLAQALMAANGPRKGPAHISMPADVLNSRVSINNDVLGATLKNRNLAVDQQSLGCLSRDLRESGRVAFYLGDGCRQDSELVMKLAELLGAPVITGPMGKRWVDETHPLYYGVFGFSGHTRARQLVMEQDYDFMVAIGTRLGELGTSGWEAALLNSKLVHVDDTVEHFSSSPMARLHVYGHLPSVLRQLVDEFRKEPVRRPDRSRRRPADELLLSEAEQAAAASDAVPLKPQRLFSALATRLPEDTRIFIDAGNAWAWATRFMQRRDTRGYYRIAMGYGSMTWAIGASVGSQAAREAAPHVCITGDGSYLMSGQEITTALQQRLPLVMIVLNDNALGMVKHGQRLGGAEQIGFELPVIDFAAMAAAMGVEGIVVETPQQLQSLDFDRLFSKQAPTLVDIRIDAEEVPPMGDRIKGLATSRSR